MHSSDRTPFEDILLEYDHLVEVGIGQRTGLAERLARAGKDVSAIDVVECAVPPSVRFFTADVSSVAHTRLEPADAVYARRLPPELHRVTAQLAQALDADLHFTTLGGEFPAINVDIASAGATTVYSVVRGESNRI